MRGMFYIELRDCICELNRNRDALTQEEQNNSNQIIIDSVIQILGLSRIARENGLLDLEESTNKITGIGANNLKYMLMDVIDGCDPETVEDMAFLKYCSNVFDAYSRLQYLIYLKGVLLIQQGCNTYLLKKYLKCMLPEEISELLDGKIEENASAESNNVYQLNQLYSKEMAITPEVKEYARIKLADITIQRLDDKAIKRVLREVTNCDLALMLKALSGDSNRAVLSNLSDRLAYMIAQDIENMSPVRLADAIEATDKIMSIICKLIDAGEIVTYECDVIPDLEKYFRIKDDPDKEEETALVESELRTLFEEYARKDHKVIF